MTWRRPPCVAAAMLLAIAGAVVVSARGLSAQTPISIQIQRLIVNGKLTDSISPAPVISVTATALPAGEASTITLEVDSVGGPLPNFLLVGSASGSAGTFVVDHLLPHRTLRFRATILDAAKTPRGQVIESYPVRSWLHLLYPVRTLNDVIPTRQPTFAWDSPGITLGPWQYTVAIINTASDSPEQGTTTDSTTFTPTTLLSACTSYRWQVTAKAQYGAPTDTLTVKSPGTFVIQNADCPLATIFYQNFPNPFGRNSRSAVTCFWFDLGHSATVTLTIYDIQLREVRHIVPGALAPAGAMLTPGPYGRQNDENQTGCDSRLQWDGRDDNGRMVPPGVYIALFAGDGVHTTHKVLFKGP